MNESRGTLDEEDQLINKWMEQNNLHKNNFRENRTDQDNFGLLGIKRPKETTLN